MIDEKGIYAIEHGRAGRVYIGATKDSFYRRWKIHLSCLVAGTHHNPALQEDWIIYGPSAFKFVPLEAIFTDTAFAPREQFWIEHMALMGYTVYNVARPIEYHPRVTTDDHSSDTPTTPEMHTVNGLAHAMGVNTYVIRTAIRRGEIQAIKVLSIYRIPHTEFLRMTGQIFTTIDSGDADA